MVPSVLLVAGARPNFMKVAPIHAALSANGGFSVSLVHTGQHYDERLSTIFFRDLGIPAPDITLDVGSGPHGAQTGRILERFEALLLERRPDLVIVVGDVNSTLACALAAAKTRYADGRRALVAHVEAGLRSFDRSMPEEINRVLTDQISDLLFTTEESAAENLAREGIRADRVFFVGNVMIDTLLAQARRARAIRAWEQFRVAGGAYAVLTLHRPSNVDDPGTLSRLLNAVRSVAANTPVIFPVHPRTAARLKTHGVELADRSAGLIVTEPLGYLEFVSLMSEASLVLTDSGGIQEETTILGVPCVTLRETTERPVTVTNGTNIVAGTDERRIREAVVKMRRSAKIRRPAPPLWDGQAAARIVRVLEETFRFRPLDIRPASPWNEPQLLR
jgi:UDP-N-acetylglucosamine 2-epimerase (non-hydrolysing)